MGEAGPRQSAITRNLLVRIGMVIFDPSEMNSLKVSLALSGLGIVESVLRTTETIKCSDGLRRLSWFRRMEREEGIPPPSSCEDLPDYVSRLAEILVEGRMKHVDRFIQRVGEFLVIIGYHVEQAILESYMRYSKSQVRALLREIEG